MKQLARSQSLIETVRNDVNNLLDEFFETRTVNAALIDDQYASLWKTMHTLSRAGGKRLRPYMTVVAYRMWGGTDDKGILPVAAAQELLHLSMLIHDDIIDRDDVRYGIKNIQGVYMDRYLQAIPDDTERQHFARSAALVAGDLLISGAYEICLTSPIADSKKLLAQRYLSQAVFNVVGGELLDTESPLQLKGSVDPLKIALFKTASYSFVVPLLTGAALADASDEDLVVLSEYGESLGVAYQLADDILGVFGDDSLTGKSTTSDLSEGKQTVLIQETLRRCTASEKEIIHALVGKHPINKDQLDSVRTIIESSGALAATQDRIASYCDTARRALSTLKVDESSKQELVNLIKIATERVK